MAQIPKVALIILSWNKKEILTETLASVSNLNVSGFELEIIVVDNHSTDGSVEAIKELKIPNLKLIVNKSNLGYVKGNNIGINRALKDKADFVAILNDDTSVDKDLVKNILAENLKNSDAGVVSGKIYFAKGYEFRKKYKANQLGNVIWYAGGDIDWKNMYGTNHGVDEVDTGQFGKTKVTDFATGCFAMYKTEALKKVGLFDERFYVYLEDIDMSLRLKKRGYKVYFCPKGVLWHKVAQSSGIGSNLNDYFITRNRMLVGMEYAPLRTKFALLRESIKLLLMGRKWQRIGVLDYYLGRFGRGSWEQ